MFLAYDPAASSQLGPPVAEASADDVADACAVAGRAFDMYRGLPHERRAAFLETIAQRILDLGDALIDRAALETGLPKARLEAERGRTVMH